MSDDKQNDGQPNQDNIVSFDFRRKEKTRKASQEDSATQGQTAAPQVVSASVGGGTLGPHPGKLIWLHCPTCGTLEYTEVPMVGGRTHNTCGTVVEEAEVELDFRAELTLADLNLERLEMFEQVVQRQRAHFEEYRKRIMLASGHNLDAYPAGHAGRDALDKVPMDDFGLGVSTFFQQPAIRFKMKEGQKPGAPSEDGAPGSAPTAPGDDPTE